MSTKKGRFFEKDNEWAWKSKREKPLKTTATIRLTQEQKEILKNTPGWQERLRNCIDSFGKDECE